MKQEKLPNGVIEYFCGVEKDSDESSSEDSDDSESSDESNEADQNKNFAYARAKKVEKSTAQVKKTILK